MGFGTTLRALYEMARITVPTFADAVVGRIDRDRTDRRLQVFADRMMKATGIKLEVEGRERVPPDGVFVYMSNHQSHTDIPVLFATVPAKTLRMIAKTELFNIPIFGKAARDAGFVEVDRGNREKAVQSLRHAEAAIKNGVSIWIAPEGTRSQTGMLGPLKKGGFHLAIGTHTPIVPVKIIGTDKVLPAHGKSMKKGQTVRVIFGAPIPVAGKKISELQDQVRAFLEAQS
jgi:1-acyl-sn-glycerol-3-phosphate acyltransferase